MEQFLIERLQNFTLDRKVLSIDSDDRDKNRWPSASEFEISTPQVYNNIESLRLINVQIPNKLYNISEDLQNNKMIIKNGTQEYTITLDDGFYNNTELCQSIQNQVNNNFSGISDNFSIYFNTVTQKPHFMSENYDFSLVFLDKNITYSTSKQCINNVYEQHSNWGLGSILGFNTKTWVESNHQTNSSSPDIFFYHENRQLLSSANVIIPDNNININCNQFIYLEIDKYNTSDEIKPFINDKINNANTGIVNSYFAKIPIKFNKDININQSLSCKDDFIDSFSYYQPVIEKISKFKIKFRHHNGKLVDLKNYNISLSIEINQIRNEMNSYDVRKPFRL
tara:strand:- start:211 stop:1224 length:1014 start_codon:yes stop_codon:yes gene_type:complete